MRQEGLGTCYPSKGIHEWCFLQHQLLWTGRNTDWTFWPLSWPRPAEESRDWRMYKNISPQVNTSWRVIRKRNWARHKNLLKAMFKHRSQVPSRDLETWSGQARHRGLIQSILYKPPIQTVDLARSMLYPLVGLHTRLTAYVSRSTPLFLSAEHPYFPEQLDAFVSAVSCG